MMQELNYIRCGDYYIPDIRLPEETRPIGRWGRMHRAYIKEHNPVKSRSSPPTDMGGELFYAPIYFKYASASATVTATPSQRTDSSKSKRGL
ncbi:MAG: TnpV protein [Oscillospiraceae bacterium]|nr:TnpV protein [Oscillospiraceae bacterium]MBR3849604.1 TnpV protein [Oscillospiraceae bacterium]